LKAEVWALLGIPATADKAAIRRAYALRMRAIDMETDRAAFLALRNAYDAALSYEEDSALHVNQFDDPVEGDGDQPVEQRQRNEPEMAVPPEMREVLELRSFLHDQAVHPLRPIEQIEEMVTQAGVAAAWKVFRGWMAKGDISLAEQNDVTPVLLSHAVKDVTLPRETFVEMTKVLGISSNAGRFETHPELQAAIEDRLAVYKWFDSVKTDAARKPRGKRKHIIRAARALLRLDTRFPRRYATMLALKRLIDTYRSHESLLHDMIEPEFLARLEAHTRKILWYWEKIILTWFGVLAITLVGDLVFQLCRDAFETVSGWLAH